MSFKMRPRLSPESSVFLFFPLRSLFPPFPLFLGIFLASAVTIKLPCCCSFFLLSLSPRCTSFLRCSTEGRLIFRGCPPVDWCIAPSLKTRPCHPKPFGPRMPKREEPLWLAAGTGAIAAPFFRVYFRSVIFSFRGLFFPFVAFFFPFVAFFFFFFFLPPFPRFFSNFFSIQ